VNVSFMNVGRHTARGHALMVLMLDEALNAEQLKKLQQIPDIYTVKLARL
jgi:hypothetical protein